MPERQTKQPEALWTRRRLLQAAAGTATLCLISRAGPLFEKENTYAEAESSYRKMALRDNRPDCLLYRDFAGASPEIDYNWPYDIAMSATLDMYLLDPGRYAGAVARRYIGLQQYKDADGGQPLHYHALPGGLDYVYVDDNIWAAFNLLRMHRLGMDKGDLCLNSAATVYKLAKKNIFPKDGGVFWMDQYHPVYNFDRGTVTTAQLAILALELNTLDRKAEYFNTAQAMQGWLYERMRDLHDGLFFDNMNHKGAINRTKWSYNQGLMIGTNRLFYDATGNKCYLVEAEKIAVSAMKHFTFTGPSDSPEFEYIFIRNLLKLEPSIDDGGFNRQVEEYIDGYINHTVRAKPADSLIKQAAYTGILALRSLNPHNCGAL